MQSMHDMIKKHALTQQFHHEPSEGMLQGQTDNHKRKGEDSSQYGSGTVTPKEPRRGQKHHLTQAYGDTRTQRGRNTMMGAGKRQRMTVTPHPP